MEMKGWPIFSSTLNIAEYSAVVDFTFKQTDSKLGVERCHFVEIRQMR